MEKLIVVCATLLALAVLLVLFVFSGAYDVAADVPHLAATRVLVGILREKSIQRRAHDIRVPPLDDPKSVQEGAEHYSAMCVDCHLAPGITVSEIRAGLEPAPPNLSEQQIDPRVAFWVIKHGIKMTGMPAWGRTHDDAKIWDIVAFVRLLPRMSAAQYRALTAAARADEHETDH